MEGAVESLSHASLSENPVDSVLQNNNDFSEMTLFKYPIPVAVVLVYLVALWIGPRWMKTKQPFKLKTVLRVYDLCQVLFNAVILVPYFIYPSGVYFLWEKSCKLDAEEALFLISDTFAKERTAYFYFCWWYMVVKIIDLLDTIFMVLMKKDNHVTFLHVYHHTSMVLFTWFTFKNNLAFQVVIPGFINASVHVIMYSYYFLSTFGPAVRKYLWWKRQLTNLQLGQFLLIIAYILLMAHNGCSISTIFVYIWLFNVAVILCLFIYFYINAYTLKTNVISEDDKKR